MQTGRSAEVARVGRPLMERACLLVVWGVAVCVGGVLAVGGCGVPEARADGGVFAREVTPTIPDQDALIVWDAKTQTQTLMIETRFAGRGSEFAWVVPVPGGLDAARPQAPEIVLGTPGVFPSLRSSFAPKVIGGQKGAEEVFGAAVLAVASFAMVLAAGLGMRWGHDRWGLVVLILIGLLVAAILMPVLGKARQSARGYEIEVLARELIGGYEVTVIAPGPGAEDASAALRTWLTGNGFVVPEVAGPALADYARRGWVFVAAKLQTGSGDEAMTRAAAPLGFRFKVAEPVYPLMLTAAFTQRLTVDLYVFGTGMALAPGFEAKRADGVVRYPGRSRPLGTLRREGEISLGNEKVLDLVPEWATVGTRLHATLDTAGMAQDAVLEVGGGVHSVGARVYTPERASVRAWAAGLWVVTGLSAAVGICRLLRTPLTRAEVNRRTLLAMMAVLPIGAVWGVVTWAGMETVDEDATVNVKGSVMWQGHGVAFEASSHAERFAATGGVLSVTEGERMVREALELSMGAEEMATKSSLIGDVPFGTSVREVETAKGRAIRFAAHGLVGEVVEQWVVEVHRAPSETSPILPTSTASPGTGER